MKDPLPKVFAVWCDPDPAVGGLLHALNAEGIDTLVIASEQWPKAWIPEWVQEPERVRYYVLVKWNFNARFIAHRDCPLSEWIEAKKIALLPPAWFRLFRRGD